MSLIIEELDLNDKPSLKRFTHFVFDLYIGSALWVPPIMSDLNKKLDIQNHPFYQQNAAAFFMAVRDARDVGRICAIHPVEANAFKERQDVWFYLFECEDDQEAANALFEAVINWGRERGLTTIRGPLGFVAADGFGVLTQGFEYLPAAGIPYNYAYYDALIKGAGLEKLRSYYSLLIDHERMRSEFPQKVLTLADKIKERNGFEVKSYKSGSALRREVAPQLLEVYNTAFAEIGNYPPVTQESIDGIVDTLLLIADPSLLKFVEKDGQIVGFLFLYPNIAAGIQRAGGKFFPFGFLHVLLERRRTEWLNLNGIGMVPEHQGRGGPAILYAELYHSLVDNRQFKYTELIQIADYNTKSLNETLQFGAEIIKAHDIYISEI